jgi:type II secretory ATPase GspE/PulE/Tfp pilus assembly ATPase PilB-like protein
MAQRLVRKLCVACRQQVQLSQGIIDEIRKELSSLRNVPIAHATNFTFYQAQGCEKCTNGYTGRIGIYEVLSMNETIESLAVSKQPASVIAQAARQEGMITLKQDGILKALKGITTIDEVWRVTSEA